MHRRRTFWFSGIQVAVPKAKPMQASYDGDKLFRGSESRAEERVNFVASRKSQVASRTRQVANSASIKKQKLFVTLENRTVTRKES